MQAGPVIQFSPQGAPLAPFQSGQPESAISNPDLRQIFQLDQQSNHTSGAAPVVNPPIEPIQNSKSYEETPSGEFAVSRNMEGTEFSSSYVPPANPQVNGQSGQENNNPAPDWLTPKIYKGGGGLG